MATLDITRLDWVDRARFWSKVKTGNLAHCWPWRGSKSDMGYGCYKFLGATRAAHRIAYAIATESWPEDMVVRHRCDNPSCCNPSHLKIGTHADNVADRVRRKRSAYGERAGRAKLTEAQVLSIADDPRDAITIAKDYPVSVDTIRSIKQKRIWKHLWDGAGTQNRTEI